MRPSTGRRPVPPARAPPEALRSIDDRPLPKVRSFEPEDPDVPAEPRPTSFRVPPYRAGCARAASRAPARPPVIRWSGFPYRWSDRDRRSIQTRSYRYPSPCCAWRRCHSKCRNHPDGSGHCPRDDCRRSRDSYLFVDLDAGPHPLLCAGSPALLQLGIEQEYRYWGTDVCTLRGIPYRERAAPPAAHSTECAHGGC